LDPVALAHRFFFGAGHIDGFATFGASSRFRAMYGLAVKNNGRSLVVVC